MQSLRTEAISTDPDVTEITVAQLYSVCELQQEWPNKCEGNGGSLCMQNGRQAHLFWILIFDD